MAKSMFDRITVHCYLCDKDISNEEFEVREGYCLCKKHAKFYDDIQKQLK